MNQNKKKPHAELLQCLFRRGKQNHSARIVTKIRHNIGDFHGLFDCVMSFFKSPFAFDDCQLSLLSTVKTSDDHEHEHD